MNLNWRRIHFDVGMYNNDKAAKCEVNDTTDGSCQLVELTSEDLD